MARWYRKHLNGQLVAFVTERRGGQHYVTITEPAGEKRFPNDQDVDNEDEGKRVADQGVQLRYPHECDAQQCTEWREHTGGSL